MQACEEKARLERVLVVFYLIFTGLGLICERFYYYHLCMLSGTITINGFHTNMLVSIFSIFLPVVMYISRDILKRSFVWVIWSYYLVSGCVGLLYRGTFIYERWKEVNYYGGTLSSDFWFESIKGIVIALLVLTVELMVIAKFRSKKILITQLMVFGVLFIYNTWFIYGREMRMMRFEQPYNYYASLQSYCSQISTFLFLFWLYVKKDPKPKKEETLVFADGHWRCASCGEVIKENNVFCAMCGKKVR